MLVEARGVKRATPRCVNAFVARRENSGRVQKWDAGRARQRVVARAPRSCSCPGRPVRHIQTAKPHTDEPLPFCRQRRTRRTRNTRSLRLPSAVLRA